MHEVNKFDIPNDLICIYEGCKNDFILICFLLMEFRYAKFPIFIIINVVMLPYFAMDVVFSFTEVILQLLENMHVAAINYWEWTQGIDCLWHCGHFMNISLGFINIFGMTYGSNCTYITPFLTVIV